ncbi:MAG: hypothetical protein QTN59_04315 [Candidatus Electrothrix communis]|nr:MAG: hypothetical protein QTN59_04315 [Candidatus Electrothrix communis]
MPQLSKATIEAVYADKENTSVAEAMEVQFNPTTMKLAISSQNEGSQAHDHVGTISTTLSMDLIFDTADQTTGTQPVSVRSKTALLEQFLLPNKKGEVPPLIKFTWGETAIIGIVDSVNIDFDLFAPDGTPLRAKMPLSIKDQGKKYKYLQAGPGDKNKTKTKNSPLPGMDFNDLSWSMDSDQIAQALLGETAPEFAARMGLDPAAWRGLDADLSGGLTLEAGAEIGFSGNLNMNAGIGATAGFQAGAGASLEASLGLEAGANASFTAQSSAGFALSSAGGVNAAITSVKNSRAESAALEARASFSVSGSASVRGAASMDSTTVDKRATSFGFGVPLRAQVKIG